MTSPRRRSGSAADDELPGAERPRRHSGHLVHAHLHVIRDVIVVRGDVIRDVGGGEAHVADRVAVRQAAHHLAAAQPQQGEEEAVLDDNTAAASSAARLVYNGRKSVVTTRTPREELWRILPYPTVPVADRMPAIKLPLAVHRRQGHAGSKKSLQQNSPGS